MSIDIFLGIALIITAGLLAHQLLKKKPAQESFDPQLFTLINDLRKEIQDTTSSQRKEVEGKLDNMHNKLVKNMQESSSTLQKHFQHTSGIIQSVTRKLTQLDETNKQVLNFSEQLQSLENILKNPKQRGILGEYWLETLLSQVLAPTNYQMQYQLGTDEKTGQTLIPDAIIFIKEMLIPIDAKFSLENYNKISQETDSTRRDCQKSYAYSRRSP